MNFSSILKGLHIMTKWDLSQEGKDGSIYENQPIQYTAQQRQKALDKTQQH
jgi:hypothetical protein